MQNDIVTAPQNQLEELQLQNTLTVFSGEENFQKAMIMATELSKSDLIPASYKNKPSNCLIAIELSNRLNQSPYLIMQNMHVINGRPSWASTFIISCINASGKFEGCLKFQMNEEMTQCRAYAVEKITGKKLTSPLVSMEMAQAEGWLTKNGSKWKTMPELMLRYRAAAFFGRLYCPEIMNGMLTMEEAKDIKTLSDNNVTNVFEDVEIVNPKELSENETKQQKLL